MESQKKIMCFIDEGNYKDAAEIFLHTPKFIFDSKNPLLKYQYFEFSGIKNKNPVFLRILLNYISLVNYLYDKGLSLKEFHEILLAFCAKFTYDIPQQGIAKLILMAKSNIESYNIFFNEGINIFNEDKDKEKLIEIDYENEDEKGIGFTFQELGKIFLNDYVIGRNKGYELPNLLFYIKSTPETIIFMNKIYNIPKELKLNINEIVINKGINEFDNIIVLNENIMIEQNNQYFRYIKHVEILNNQTLVKYDNLNLEDNVLYIIEFKHAYHFNEDIANLENHSKLYMDIYNRNAIQINNAKIFTRFCILYFYNAQENLGYKNFLSFNITPNLWKFLYLNPASQIIPVIKLTKDVSEMKNEIKGLKDEIKELKDEMKEMKDEMKEMKDVKNEMIENRVILNKILSENKNIVINKNDLPKKIIQSQIEEMFSDLMHPIKKVKDLKKVSNELYERYKEGINNFITVEDKDKLDINIRDGKFKTKLKEEIPDDDFKTCFEVFIPCIGENKSSANFYKILNYLYKKSQKNDEMQKIYKCIYYCFFGERTPNDKKSKELFYNGNSKSFITLLRNIIKYTFYYDKKREGKYYYLLLLFKELVDNGDNSIYNSIIALKDKTLFEVIFNTIVLFNEENRKLSDGFFF